MTARSAIGRRAVDAWSPGAHTPLVSSKIRPLLLGAGVLALGALLAWLGGAFGDGDAERIGAVADDFRGEVDMDQLDAALRHVDPSVAPVEVDARGFTRVYGRGAVPDLRRDATRALGPVMGSTFRELRRDIALGDDGESATAVLELLSTEHGTATVSLGLVRAGDRWLVRRVNVSR